MLSCLICKSPIPHYLEDRRLCAKHARQQNLSFLSEQLKEKDFASASSSVFVGRYNYPNVNVGILAPPISDEHTWMLDAPDVWSKQNVPISRIVSFRSSLLNNRFSAHILDPRKSSKFLSLSQELSMVEKPTDIEIHLEEKPHFTMNFSDTALPFGPATKLKEIEVTQNPSVNQRIEKIVYDTDLKATEGLTTLYEKGISEHSLSKVLSVGNLGLKKDRKLVPTRYAITAVDDTLGKHLLNEIKDNEKTGYLAHFGSYLGNYYLILFFPEIWSYELFEMYTPSFRGDNYSTDAESFQGRTTYAENTAGGYYTVRLAIAEKLSRLHRQSSVLALRFITDEYEVPLGVWVTREAARKALEEKPIEFGSKELMLEYSKKIALKKFHCDLSTIFDRSFILKNVLHQKKLFQF